MKIVQTKLQFLFCLALVFMTPLVFADENVEVVSANGSVTIGESRGKSEKAAQTKTVLATGSVLSTGPDARAVVRLGSQGVVVLGQNTQVEINKSADQVSFFKHITGIVYYALNSIKSHQKPIEIRTTTTTIGIRGTRFLVTDTGDRNEIGMRKGQINITSLEGEFEVHKKAQQDEFEAMKQEAATAILNKKREFEDYKKNTQQEFIEYKRVIGLEANRMATFSGKRVEELPLSGETQKDMESIENYAEEWLKGVHD